jgi:hypothetical protein
MSNFWVDYNLIDLAIISQIYLDYILIDILF